jgi:YD repeat-containing protein
VKALFSAIILLFSVGVAASQEPPFTLAREHLLGKVKTVKFARVSYREAAENKPQVYQTISFDERGNRTEAIIFEQNGEISTRFVYTYDAQGRNTGYDEYVSLLDKSLQTPRHHVFNLDDNGRIIESFVRESSGQVGSHFTYRYDSKGRKLEEIFRGTNDAPLNRIVYTYDEAGHLLTQTVYDREDAVSSRTVNLYDAEGRQIEWQLFTPDTLKYKRVLSYGADGRLAEEETFAYYAPREIAWTHSPVPGRVVYTYNDKSHSQEVAYYQPGGKLDRKEVRTFDDQGNESGLTSFESSPHLKNASDTITNEYDARGNLVRKVRSRPHPGSIQPSPYFAEIKIITYYEE